MIGIRANRVSRVKSEREIEFGTKIVEVVGKKAHTLQ